jgi:hypothetical protein
MVLDFTTNYIATQTSQPANSSPVTINTGNASAFAALLNNATLGTGLGSGGTISSFVATIWFKQPAMMLNGSTVGPRLWILNAGAPGVDTGGGTAANVIGLKFQQNNQLAFSIGTENPTFLGSLASPFPTNKWLFVAIVYDSTNFSMYYGSDTEAAQLIGTRNSLNRSINLGGAATLAIGNRRTGITNTRGLNGWINDFRFYNGWGDAAFVESVRESVLGGPPSISGVYPDGTKLLQATNSFAFNAISSGSTITNVSLILNGVNVSAGLVTSGPANNLSVTYPSLQINKIYTATISVTDANGLSSSYYVNGIGGVFDTFTSTNLLIEAEEFDHDGGLFIDNADYTSYATNTSYFGLDSAVDIDTHKGSGAGSSATGDYRVGSGDQTKTQTPPNNGDLPRQRFLDLVAAGDATVVDHYLGFWSSAEWQNYTKTFPAGKYNVYGRLAAGAGSAVVTFAHVTSGQGTASQTTTKLGTFSLTGTSYTTYQWIPLRDGVGNLATIDLSGVNTVRATSGGGANVNFYIFVPANTNLPVISGVYPNGAALFQATNKLVFTVSSPVTTISTNSITLTLNGTNVFSSLVFSGGPSTWNVSYTGLQLSQTYTAVINVTDANGNTSSSTLNIDTWNPVFQIEGEDFDFSGGQYIDNPVPTTGSAANSYFGQIGTEGIDEHTAAPHTGGSPNNYRPDDLTATTLVTDAARQQFIDAGAPDYNVGFLGNFFWQNYTKTFPAGTYNVHARIARGDAGAVTINFDKITGGWGTTAQFTKRVGTFTLPGGDGWSAYKYSPLIDTFGNYANVVLGGTNTFRATVSLPVNINFYMLVPARTDLPRIDNVYPDGSILRQQTNTLSFVASSPTYGMNTTNIHVTLNGTDVSSQLAFSGSSASWNVSYSGLQPNMTYAAVISITDVTNQTRTTTVNFDTFSPNNFTWEAEDWDFDPSQSPVPNGSGLRYIDNPAPTSSPATNSYFGQIGDGGQISGEIDYSSIFTLTHPGTYAYRALDYVSAEVTGDAPRQKFLDAQLLNTDPAIVDHDVSFWATNGWINYTRTFPAGNFYLYARLSAGNGAFNLQCAEVTSGAGTASQVTQPLGSFKGSGTSFATWQYVPLVDANTNKVTLSFGGVKTLQLTGDYNENVNFLMLVPVVPNSVTLTASISGPNILLSFPTQTGFNYTVYYKNNLTDPIWTPLGDSVLGDGTIKTVTDGMNGGSRFYRLTIQ